MRGRAHSDELRAKAIAALAVGQTPADVARSCNLDLSVVSRWRKSIVPEQLQAVASRQKDDFDTLLASYLKANLNALAVQCEVASDPDYLKKQNAGDLATLHGTFADRAVRIFEAAERALMAAAERSG